MLLSNSMRLVAVLFAAAVAAAGQTQPDLQGMFTRIPDVRWDEIRHYVHPDVAVVEWITSGTPHGGTRYEVYGCDVLAIRDGRISAKRSFRKGVI